MNLHARIVFTVVGHQHAGTRIDSLIATAQITPVRKPAFMEDPAAEHLALQGDRPAVELQRHMYVGART